MRTKSLSFYSLRYFLHSRVLLPYGTRKSRFLLMVKPLNLMLRFTVIHPCCFVPFLPFPSIVSFRFLYCIITSILNIFSKPIIMREFKRSPVYPAYPASPVSFGFSPSFLSLFLTFSYIYEQ
jgi:hypothetical protein